MRVVKGDEQESNSRKKQIKKWFRKKLQHLYEGRIDQNTLDLANDKVKVTMTTML